MRSSALLRSPALLLFCILAMATSAPAADAQGGGQGAYQIFVHDPHDAVSLDNDAAVQLVVSGSEYAANLTYFTASPTTWRTPHAISIKHSYDRSRLAGSPFRGIDFPCSWSHCAGEADVSLNLISLGFNRSDPLLVLETGDLTPQSCGASEVPASAHGEQSRHLELLIGWWSAYKDCLATGEQGSLTAVSDLAEALNASAWLAVHIPDRYAVAPNLLSEAATTLQTSPFCTGGPPTLRACAALRGALARAAAADTALLTPINYYLNHPPIAAPAVNSRYAIQALIAARHAFDTCSSPDAVQYQACTDFINFSAADFDATLASLCHPGGLEVAAYCAHGFTR